MQSAISSSASAIQLPKIKYYIVVGILTVGYLILYDFFIGKNYNGSTSNWQKNLNVSETFFPLIFGYFLDKYGRKNCMVMLALSAIVPGLIITLLAFFTRMFEFVRMGMLLLGAAYQSCTVAIIIGLFAWTGNILVYIISVTIARMLSLVNDIYMNSEIPSLYDKIFVPITLSITLVLMVWLWWLEENQQPQPQQNGKKYLLNVYFLFATVQSFNSCISDLILQKILTDKMGPTVHQIIIDHNIGTLVCYGAACFIIIMVFFQKNLTIIVLTFLADLIMSFAILMLVLLNGTNSFTDPTRASSTSFMKPAINLLSVALTSTAGYIFLASSLTIILKSTDSRGMAVGASISIYRLTWIILSYEDSLMLLIWIGLTVLLIQKLSYFLIGFYDTKRFRIMFRPVNEMALEKPPQPPSPQKFRSDSSASIVNCSYV